ncbi:SnoaL-like domain-containing protein [Aeromonas sp. RU39B]|uniref:nuclear transport factor 2 family protein n=1 Tax=Aeromonas sp. RU39B TaxID=1907416 RepID=UPI000954C3DE|nr:nuclear transport factor 2 family protein [Aeromonas sp. RU39B]SIQ86836.1 SnoaL-like domain-containing protein [Aeromonas sp. RU39B]
MTLTGDPRLQRIASFYQMLDRHQLHRLGEIYASEVVFEDPAHRLDGLDALARYFVALYAHVTDIHFEMHEGMSDGDNGWLAWTMTLLHPRLAKGNPVVVEGVTRLEFDTEGKVRYHRDYFDLGAMLYEQLPLLGALIRSIKGRLGQ